MAENLLNIDQLRVDYRPRTRGGEPVPALQLASLRIDRGQILAVCGPSGCGKTTLGRALMGMLPATASVSGSIKFTGQELAGLTDRQWRRLRGRQITGISQDATAALNPVLRIGKQLTQVGCDADKALRLLHQMGLPAGRNWLRAYPHELSGGQCQRVALALALACEPLLLVADEPTAALDNRTSRDVMALIQAQAQQRQMSVLLITHDQPLVKSLGLTSVELGASEQSDPQAAGIALASNPKRSVDASDATPTLLGIRNLTVHYPGADPATPALDDVSLALPIATTTAVIGPSGGGKSTLARAVMGLLPSVNGQISLNGRPLAVHWQRERLPIQFVLQDTFASLNPRRNIQQVLTESLAQEGARADTAAHCLEEVGLGGGFLQRYPHELSGGQRQRVALARALTLSPQLIVLDEAFSALDIPVRDALLGQLLLIQRERSISYLMITHDTARLAAVAHYTAVLEAGRLVKYGPTQQILDLHTSL